MTPVRGNNEKHASANERKACDNRSRCSHLEGRDLSDDEPDTGEQDQQEANLGKSDSSLVADRRHGNDGNYFHPKLPKGVTVPMVGDDAIAGKSATTRRYQVPWPQRTLEMAPAYR